MATCDEGAGVWEKTPWLLVCILRKPKFRRYVALAHIGGDFSYYEYSDEGAHQ